MFININCKYNVDHNYCSHPKVKRSWFGLGPRMCVYMFKPCLGNNGCEHQDIYPKPNKPPPAQRK